MAPNDRRGIADASGAVPERAPITLDDVRDRVTALRMRGFDEVRLARMLEADGIDAALIRRAVAGLDDDERRRKRRTWTITVAGSAALSFACFILDRVLGTERSFGVVFAVVFFAVAVLGGLFLLSLFRER